MLRRELSEAREGNGLAALQGIRDRIEERVHCRSGVALAAYEDAHAHSRFRLDAHVRRRHPTGVVVLRGHDFDQFLRWVGVRPAQKTTSHDVQSYAQRTVLLYIGWRIFLGHPAAGVGWQASSEHSSYAPYLAAAHRRFPHTADKAFPGPGHEYGVQNGWVQALADLGVIGFALFAGFFATCFVFAARVVRRGPPEVVAAALLGLAWVAVIAGAWTAQGLVAGIPLDAVLWLAVGLTIAAAAGVRNVRA